MFEKIQLLMMQNGMNKAEFAKAVGASPGNISDWANGRTQPSVDKLVRIADHFGVSIDYLVGRDDRFPKASRETFNLIRIFESLDDDGRTIVRAAALQQMQRMELEKNVTR